MQKRLIRLREVQLRTGLSRSGIYAAVNAGTFPHQVKLGPAGARAAGWVESSIDAWIQRLIDANSDVKEGGHLTVPETAQELLHKRKPISSDGGKRNG